MVNRFRGNDTTRYPRNAFSQRIFLMRLPRAYLSYCEQPDSKVSRSSVKSFSPFASCNLDRVLNPSGFHASRRIIKSYVELDGLERVEVGPAYGRTRPSSGYLSFVLFLFAACNIVKEEVEYCFFYIQCR